MDVETPLRPSPPIAGSAVSFEPEFEEGLLAEETRLLDYVRVLYRRRWVALTTFLTVVLLVACTPYSPLHL
jgi:hypothetical protein